MNLSCLFLQTQLGRSIAKQLRQSLTISTLPVLKSFTQRRLFPVMYWNAAVAVKDYSYGGIKSRFGLRVTKRRLCAITIEYMTPIRFPHLYSPFAHHAVCVCVCVCVCDHHTYIMLFCKCFRGFRCPARAPLLRAQYISRIQNNNDGTPCTKPWWAWPLCGNTQPVVHQRPLYSQSHDRHYRFPVSESTKEVLFERQHAATSRRSHRVGHWHASCAINIHILVFGAFTLSVGRQEEHPACKNWVEVLMAWLSVCSEVRIHRVTVT